MVMASGYILGGGALLNELSVNQRNNIYWTVVYIKKGVGMYMLDSSLMCLNEGDGPTQVSGRQELIYTYIYLPTAKYIAF